MEHPQEPDPRPSPRGGRPPEGGSASQAVRARLGYLHKQYNFLETLVAFTVSALILMSLGLNLFLFKQMRLTRGQLHHQKQVSAVMLDEFYNKREPAIKDFVVALQTYSQSHPDFSPILEQFRPHLARYFTATVPPTQ